MKLLRIATYLFRKDDFKEFMHTTDELASESETITTQLAVVFNPFDTAEDKMVEVYNRPEKGPITALRLQLDKQRDRLLTGARHYAYSYEESEDPLKVAAAKKVMFAFESSGLSNNASYIAQTAQTERLLDYVKNRIPESVEEIGMKPMFQEIERINERMHELSEERFGEFDKNAWETARTDCDRKYHEFETFLNIWAANNASVLETEYPDLVTFIEKQNQKISYFNSYVLHTPSTENPDEGEGGETNTPGGGEQQQPEDFTPEQLRDFPIYPSQYGAVTEITNPNSLISPFNPLSINYKLSNLLPGTPAPTEGEVPAGKAKVKFDREAEEEEARAIKRFLHRELRKEKVENLENLENVDILENLEETDSALLDTKSFCLWYDLGSSVQTQGFVPECLTGFHWDIQQMDYVLDTAHHTIRLVKDEDEDENQGGEQTLTPGMDWPFDVPAPEGWTKVIFRDKNGRETVKLYRNGSSVYSQGGYPENAPGYEWIGIHAILNGTTHTITEYEE